MEKPNKKTPIPKKETQKCRRRTKDEKVRESADAAPRAQHAPDVPHWIPNDYRWDQFPPQVRDAVVRIVTPAYRQFVLEAPGELERSVGLTLVHLTWLEICDQIQMAAASADPSSLDAILGDPQGTLDRHLRLATAKCQTAELLMKLRIVDHLAPPQLPQANASGRSVPLLETSSADPDDQCCLFQPTARRDEKCGPEMPPLGLETESEIGKIKRR